MQSFIFGGKVTGSRISRQPWWQITVFGSILVTLIILYIGTITGFMLTGIVASGLVLIFLQFCLCVGISYVTIKRFHDRDKSGWWSLLFIVPGAIYFVVMLVDVVFPYSSISAVMEGLYRITKPLTSISLLWWLIECGFLKGTKGPNKYGPDPLISIE